MDFVISSPGGDKYILDQRHYDSAPTEFFVDIAVRSVFLHGPTKALRPSPSRKEHYYDRVGMAVSEEASSSDDA